MAELLTAQTLDLVVREALDIDPEASVVDVIVEFVEERGLEFETIAHIASSWLREKLRVDYMERRMLEKKNVLPFES